MKRGRKVLKVSLESTTRRMTNNVLTSAKAADGEKGDERTTDPISCCQPWMVPLGESGG